MSRLGTVFPFLTDCWRAVYLSVRVVLFVCVFSSTNLDKTPVGPSLMCDTGGRMCHGDTWNQRFFRSRTF